MTKMGDWSAQPPFTPCPAGGAESPTALQHLTSNAYPPYFYLLVSLTVVEAQVWQHPHSHAVGCPSPACYTPVSTNLTVPSSIFALVLTTPL